MIDPGPIGGPGYQVEPLARVTARFSRVLFVLEHLGYLGRDDMGDRTALTAWRRLVGLGARDNVYLGFSGVGHLLAEPYPCPGALALLRQAVGLCGPAKILWGSDAPGTLRRHTYRDMIDIVRTAADFLSAADCALILGGNALRLLPVSAPPTGFSSGWPRHRVS